jgi:hypothetical protein
MERERLDWVREQPRAGRVREPRRLSPDLGAVQAAAFVLPRAEEHDVTRTDMRAARGEQIGVDRRMLGHIVEPDRWCLADCRVQRHRAGAWPAGPHEARTVDGSEAVLCKTDPGDPDLVAARAALRQQRLH